MRNIRLSTLTVILITALFTESGCSKDPDEEALKISIDASAFTITQASNFSFNVKIESAVPPAGVRIEYNVKGETVNMVYPQGPAINTFDRQVGIYLSNLPRQVTCICTVTVYSKGKSDNSATTNFRVVYK